MSGSSHVLSNMESVVGRIGWESVGRPLSAAEADIAASNVVLLVAHHIQQEPSGLCASASHGPCPTMAPTAE